MNLFNWFRRAPKLGKPRKVPPKPEPDACLLNGFPAGTLVYTDDGAENNIRKRQKKPSFCQQLGFSFIYCVSFSSVDTIIFDPSHPQ